MERRAASKVKVEGDQVGERERWRHRASVWVRARRKHSKRWKVDSSMIQLTSLEGLSRSPVETTLFGAKAAAGRHNRMPMDGPGKR